MRKSKRKSFYCSKLQLFVYQAVSLGKMFTCKFHCTSIKMDKGFVENWESWKEKEYCVQTMYVGNRSFSVTFFWAILLLTTQPGFHFQLTCLSFISCVLVGENVAAIYNKIHTKCLEK